MPPPPDRRGAGPPRRGRWPARPPLTDIRWPTSAPARPSVRARPGRSRPSLSASAASISSPSSSARSHPDRHQPDGRHVSEIPRPHRSRRRDHGVDPCVEHRHQGLDDAWGDTGTARRHPGDPGEHRGTHPGRRKRRPDRRGMNEEQHRFGGHGAARPGPAYLARARRHWSLRRPAVRWPAPARERLGWLGFSPSPRERSRRRHRPPPPRHRRRSVA